MASENGARKSGLLIDWGGVMTTNLFDSFRAFCTAHGIEPDSIRDRFRGDPDARQLLVDLETGAIEEEAFEPQFAAMLGVQATGLIDGLFGGAGPDTPMLEAVLKARRAGIKTGLISNSWGTRRYDRAKLKELFDGVVISGEEGMRKPAPEMYTLGAERIGLPASECVYVDDLPFNLTPAAELGMTTIHHVSADETIPELERLLGVALR